MSDATIQGKDRAARTAKPPACRHCGAPLIDARMEQTGFCCAGCAYVYRLVHEHGLEGYYRLKDPVTVPADPAVFQPRDYAWLEPAQRAAEQAAGDRAPELACDVQGISCAGCVWLIERLFQQQPGARDIVVNAQTGQMRLRWVRSVFRADDFARKLQAFGYLMGPAGEPPGDAESRALAKRLGLCAAFALNVMLFTLPTYFGMQSTFEYARLFGTLSLLFGTLSLLVGGSYFLGRAVRALREGVVHIDLPIALGIIGAYLGSLYGWVAGEGRFVYFDFVATFILLMLAGRWAQVVAVERNQRRLLSRQPKPRRLRTVDATGAPGEVPPEALLVGQIFFLEAGQTLPVEARLESGEAIFSLASISGEAEPRVFWAGERVPAGAVNVGRSEVRLAAQQRWAESLLAQLLQPGERTGWRHRFLERIVQGYLIAIFAVAFCSGIGWWWATGDVLRTWSVVTSVLVVSCPCAIGLAFPLAEEMATVALRRRGVFVRENDLWAKLSRVRKIVFDKTGTLTLETPVLLNPEALAALDAPTRAALHALVRDNPHPVSQCLLENLLASGAPEPLAGEVRETVGFGVELLAATGRRWSLGRPDWSPSAANVTHKVTILAPPISSFSPLEAPQSVTHKVTNSGTVADGGEVVLACDGRPMAAFRMADRPRADARRELARLAARGFALFILSGDRREKVAALAAEFQLPAAHGLGELTPQAKAAWFGDHDRRDTLMLGDGANDSLAFDRAFCRGTPVIHRGLLEQKADFYYLGRGMGGIRALFEINAVRRRVQVMILVFSVLYNLLAVGFAVAGRMNPLVAAILMPVNSLLTLAIVTGGMRPAFSPEPLAPEEKRF
jgi:Cu2+-exporting ATPase